METEKINKIIYKQKKIVLKKYNYPCKNIKKEYINLKEELIKENNFLAGFFYGYVQGLTRIRNRIR